MIIDNKFNFGEKVYLITDIDQKQRLVTGMSLRMESIGYELSCGSEISTYYDFEISKEKNIVIEDNG